MFSTPCRVGNTIYICGVLLERLFRNIEICMPDDNTVTVPSLSKSVRYIMGGRRGCMEILYNQDKSQWKGQK